MLVWTPFHLVLMVDQFYLLLQYLCQVPLLLSRWSHACMHCPESENLWDVAEIYCESTTDIWDIGHRHELETRIMLIFTFSCTKV